MKYFRDSHKRKKVYYLFIQLENGEIIKEQVNSTDYDYYYIGSILTGKIYIDEEKNFKEYIWDWFSNSKI